MSRALGFLPCYVLCALGESGLILSLFLIFSGHAAQSLRNMDRERVRGSVDCF